MLEHRFSTLAMLSQAGAPSVVTWLDHSLSVLGQLAVPYAIAWAIRNEASEDDLRALLSRRECRPADIVVGIRVVGTDLFFSHLIPRFVALISPDCLYQMVENHPVVDSYLLNTVVMPKPWVERTYNDQRALMSKGSNLYTPFQKLSSTYLALIRAALVDGEGNFHPRAISYGAVFAKNVVEGDRFIRGMGGRGYSVFLTVSTELISTFKSLLMDGAFNDSPEILTVFDLICFDYLNKGIVGDVVLLDQLSDDKFNYFIHYFAHLYRYLPSILSKLIDQLDFTTAHERLERLVRECDPLYESLDPGHILRKFIELAHLQLRNRLVTWTRHLCP